ncbi:ATPase, H transporting, lysosomal V1 subunit F, isoform CRA_b [Rattus norvegicus]|uniref:ATPase, H transporting, lysosomal V1 subunit F, isoform CRA_b n=1 Tax=Rattus norvegicus TaxID=10116 RepID=A6IED8_RAT|nr:ATPase, H transporting, lysosomal V1 subunit F, isoform CRA_b [Rattus norvegicus]
MTSASFSSTSTSQRWFGTPSMPTRGPFQPSWRSRPRSIPTTQPKTPSCAGPRACSLLKTCARAAQPLTLLSLPGLSQFATLYLSFKPWFPAPPFLFTEWFLSCWGSDVQVQAG